MAPKLIRRGGGGAGRGARSSNVNSSHSPSRVSNVGSSWQRQPLSIQAGSHNRASSRSPSRVSNAASSRQDRALSGRRTSFLSSGSDEDLKQDASATSAYGSPRSLTPPRRVIVPQEPPNVGVVDDKVCSTLRDIKQALEDNIASSFKELRDDISKEIQSIVYEIRISQVSLENSKVNSPLLGAGLYGTSPGQIKTAMPKTLSRQLFNEAYDARSEDAALSEVFQFGRRDGSRTLDVLAKRRMETGAAPEEIARLRAAMEALATTQKNFKDNFVQDVDIRNCREDMRKLNINIQKTVDGQTSEIARQLTQVCQDMNSLEKTLRDQVLLVGKHAQTIANRLDASKDSSPIPAFGSHILDTKPFQSPSLELSQLQHVSEDSVQRLAKLETTSRALLERVSVVFGLGGEGGRSNTITSVNQGLSEFEKSLHNHRLEMGRAIDSLRANMTDNGKIIAETVQGQLRASHQSFLDDLLVHLVRTY